LARLPRHIRLLLSTIPLRLPMPLMLLPLVTSRNSRFKAVLLTIAPLRSYPKVPRPSMLL
jgi:hypothetical protein